MDSWSVRCGACDNSNPRSLSARPPLHAPAPHVTSASTSPNRSKSSRSTLGVHLDSPLPFVRRPCPLSLQTAGLFPVSSGGRRPSGLSLSPSRLWPGAGPGGTLADDEAGRMERGRGVLRMMCPQARRTWETASGGLGRGVPGELPRAAQHCPSAEMSEGGQEDARGGRCPGERQAWGGGLRARLSITCSVNGQSRSVHQSLRPPPLPSAFPSADSLLFPVIVSILQMELMMLKTDSVPCARRKLLSPPVTVCCRRLLSLRDSPDPLDILSGGTQPSGFGKPGRGPRLRSPSAHQLFTPRLWLCSSQRHGGRDKGRRCFLSPAPPCTGSSVRSRASRARPSHLTLLVALATPLSARRAREQEPALQPPVTPPRTRRNGRPSLGSGRSPRRVVAESR